MASVAHRRANDGSDASLPFDLSTHRPSSAAHATFGVDALGVYRAYVNSDVSQFEARAGEIDGNDRTYAPSHRRKLFDGLCRVLPQRHQLPFPEHSRDYIHRGSIVQPLHLAGAVLIRL